MTYESALPTSLAEVLIKIPALGRRDQQPMHPVDLQCSGDSKRISEDVKGKCEMPDMLTSRSVCFFTSPSLPTLVGAGSPGLCATVLLAFLPPSRSANIASRGVCD